MNVLEFKRPDTAKSDPNPEETGIRLTRLDEAKLIWASKKMDVPMNFGYEVVKWPHQANTTAEDFGIEVDENGEITLYDEDLAVIKEHHRTSRFLVATGKIFAFNCGVIIGLLILFY